MDGRSLQRTDTARPIDTQYEDLLRRILEQGTPKQDRTGTGTVSLFGERLRYDLSESFPLVTTKKVHFKSIAVELLWFLRGDSNVGWLREQRRHHLGRVGLARGGARPGLRRPVAVVAHARTAADRPDLDHPRRRCGPTPTPAA